MLAVTAAVAVGCAQPERTAPRRVTYVCPGGMLLFATFPDDDRMRLTVTGSDYDLPRLISASGARYGSAGVTFWSEGERRFSGSRGASPTRPALSPVGVVRRESPVGIPYRWPF